MRGYTANSSTGECLTKTSLKMKAILSILTALLFISVVSCEKVAEPEINQEAMKLEISGEGGQIAVEIGSGEWKITQIVNNEGNVRIFGDTYTPDGKIIRKNQPLELVGLGSLVTSGNRWGFQIIHETPGTINVILRENASGRPVSFRIVLQNGQEKREIKVEQSVSAGYSFDGIEYYLEKDDGDSVYLRQSVVTYEFNLAIPMEVEIMPFGGPNIVVNSHFESEDPYAFLWFEDEPLEVQVPVEINNGDILLSYHKNIYGEISNEPYKADTMVTVQIRAGTTKFTKDVEMRNRLVSYRLTIKNNRTGKPKEIFGKWIEISPTGEYEIREIK